MWVDDDCVCGDSSVGCVSLRAYWSNRFGLAKAVSLVGLQAVRFHQRCTWPGYEYLPWVVFLTMQPTAAEIDDGIDLKQLRWEYPKTTEWTETTLDVIDAEWQWRNADNGMWMSSGGNTQLTEMVAIEWYQNIPFGLEIGERKLIDDLAFVGTGTAAPDDTPAAAILHAVYPNPANPSVTVALDLPRAGHVRADLLDVRGRLVTRLHDGWLVAGPHRLRWRDDDAPSGAYVVRVRALGGQESMAVTVVR